MSKLEMLKTCLQQVINNIDAGNSYLDESQCEEILGILIQDKYSKYQACKYLNISRSTFDRYVKSGIIPPGRKQQGFKEIFYLKQDLDNVKNQINNN